MGTRAHTTPAVAVAGKTCVNGPDGQAVVPVGDWQPPKLPLERVTIGQLGGHICWRRDPSITGAGTGARVRLATGTGAKQVMEEDVTEVVRQPLGHVVTPFGDVHTPIAPRVQRRGQEGTRAQITPAEAVACSSRRQGPVGHTVTVTGASQLPRSSGRHNAGHLPCAIDRPLMAVGLAERMGGAVGHTPPRQGRQVTPFLAVAAVCRVHLLGQVRTPRGARHRPRDMRTQPTNSPVAVVVTGHEGSTKQMGPDVLEAASTIL